VYYLSKCTSAFHEDWIGLDAKKISEFRSYTSVDKALVTCSVSGSDKLCDLEGYGNTGEDKRETT
jgi:hypothetical protein